MKKFSDEERERIREQLVRTGRELVLTYGPEKTTVKDVTDPVGIAKPTFYQFFDAKSDLYLEILEREIEEYVENVRTELEGIDDPQEALERFFWCYVEFGEENPFVQQMIIRGNYRELIERSSGEALNDVQEQRWAEFVPIIEEIKARSDGPVAKMDPLTIGGLMSGTLGWLMIHKDEYELYETELETIDQGYYEHLQETLISTIARGLTIAE
ncbi:TetR/AcrR family transcriptional regulator [Natrarchaeobius oligotrophus]|uniref:TetR/AcrR family transcriptional regulator n=1 Tax=Natrarchaeobius chitinivorans TaxID=1679083 RepID=A0A3N6NJS9_NATCH|nr:helix-turn-helix domain-containing protein [Natrarchaeobius chitinivorans]RQG99392.1 TetR/AcrR family transcriptional regulator [Natrarchaeobius chitinivorans]